LFQLWSIYYGRMPTWQSFMDSLYSGHGVTWNESQDLLYALSYDQLRAYSLKNWDSKNPGLSLVSEWTLPETGGHDLFAPTETIYFFLQTKRFGNSI
jgi:hypothetical protein